MPLARIVVLASGRGSNLAALLEAERDGRIEGSVVQVLSNRPDAAALAVARENGVPATAIDHRDHNGREAFDDALAVTIDRAEPDLVVLAGFMRVLGRRFVERYANRMLNVHPSLLPAYPGLHTHRRALDDGARVHGCTVHFVGVDVDAGPVVAQASLAVAPGDDEASLAARVLALEHGLLPEAVGWFCAGRLVIEAGRVRVIEAPASPDGA